MFLVGELECGGGGGRGGLSFSINKDGVYKTALALPGLLLNIEILFKYFSLFFFCFFKCNILLFCYIKLK